MLRKGTNFSWNEKTALAFQAIKDVFTSASFLHHPNSSKQYILETDASDWALAGILSQNDDDQILRPIAFHSRQFTAAEKNYDVYDKEMLAIIDCLKTWRHLVQGGPEPILIYTDHKNLAYFTDPRLLTRRQARWVEFLGDFDIKISHRSGTDNKKADCLSRHLPNPTAEKEHRQPLITSSQIAAIKITLKVPEQEFLTQIKEAQNQQPPDPTKDKKAWSLKDNTWLYHGLIYVPTERLQVKILQARHDSPTAGHYGIEKTLYLIQRDYWWPKMRNIVKRYVLSCICQRSKTARHKPHGLLQPLPIPETPWSSIATDFIVELPPSEGYNAISVWIDRLTKMAHFVPCSTTTTADDLATLFINNIFKLHGLPKQVISDRGPQFISRFWNAFCSKLNIKVSLSSAFHPQTDGQTERVNQTLEQYLRCYLSYNQDNWVSLLPLAEFAYNNAANASTNISPFFANYGFHPKMDDCQISLPDNPTLAPLDKAEEIKEILKSLKSSLAQAQESHKTVADRKRLDKTFSTGSQVWLNSKNIKTTRPSKKLDYKKLGPFKILEKIGLVAYRLQLPPTMNIHNVFHVSLLEPFQENNLASRPLPKLSPIIVNDQQEFEVEAILDSRLIHRQGQYLVHWKRFATSEATWEPASHLINSPELIAEFHSLFPSKPGPFTPVPRFPPQEKGRKDRGGFHPGPVMDTEHSL